MFERTRSAIRWLPALHEDVKSDGHVVIPKGSKLIGHVTQAQAKGQGESQSSLGVVFDRAIPKHGPEMPVNLVIQAVAAAQSTASAMADEGSLMGSASGMGSGSASGGASRSGGGLVGGAGSAVGAVTTTAGQAVGATANTATSATGAVNGPHSGVTGMLNSTSSGVIGLKGLSLSSEGSNFSQGSLIVSSTRNVHLDSGTQMLLRAEGRAQPHGQGQVQGQAQSQSQGSVSAQKNPGHAQKP